MLLVRQPKIENVKLTLTTFVGKISGSEKLYEVLENICGKKTTFIGLISSCNHVFSSLNLRRLWASADFHLSQLNLTIFFDFSYLKSTNNDVFNDVFNEVRIGIGTAAYYVCGGATDFKVIDLSVSIPNSVLVSVLLMVTFMLILITSNDRFNVDNSDNVDNVYKVDNVDSDSKLISGCMFELFDQKVLLFQSHGSSRSQLGQIEF